MQTELLWLTYTTVFTLLLWIPYIVQTIMEVGLGEALRDRNGTVTVKAPWAARLKRAHSNAVENLVVFAPLVIIAVMTHNTTELTAMLAMVYFFARVAHAVIYALGLPTLRTLSFAVGVFCQLGIALVILGAL